MCQSTEGMPSAFSNKANERVLWPSQSDVMLPVLVRVEFQLTSLPNKSVHMDRILVSWRFMRWSWLTPCSVSGCASRMCRWCSFTLVTVVVHFVRCTPGHTHQICGPDSHPLSCRCQYQGRKRGNSAPSPLWTKCSYEGYSDCPRTQPASLVRVARSQVSST